MLRPISYPLVLGCALLAAQPAAAFVVGPPTTPGDPSPNADQSKFQMGYDLGYEQGFGRGLEAGVAECVADPAGCGIALADPGPSGNYGETEPNDNLASADILVNGQPFRGQSYGEEDADWFMINVGDNRALTINFALADMAAGSLAGWTVSVVNAFKVSQAEFNTGLMPVANTLDGMNYELILGRTGPYYIVVEPVPGLLNFQPYRLTGTLSYTPTPPDTTPPVGAIDAETEPNNEPEQADTLNEGVAMYGLVNLRFSDVLPGDPVYTWLQGEYDWFRYESPGNEILQIAFCDRQLCSTGNWLVQFFDEARALHPEDYLDPDYPLTPGADDFDNAALVSFNTTTCGGDPCAPGIASDDPEPWHIGVTDPGTYYFRVGHKRLITAPCTAYNIDKNNDGFICDEEDEREDGLECTPETDPCGCASGYSCEITIRNPGGINAPPYDLCPDGSGGGDDPQCAVGCLCTKYGSTIQFPDADEDGLGDTTSQYNFSLTTNPFGGGQRSGDTR